MTDMEWEALKPFAERYDAAKTAYNALMLSDAVNGDLRTRIEHDLALTVARQEFHDAIEEYIKAQRDVLP